MPTANSITFVAETGQTFVLGQSSQYSIRQTLGAEPYYFHAPIHEDDLTEIEDMLTDAQAADEYVFGKLVIVTSDDTPSGSRTIEWENWIMVRIDPDNEIDAVRHVLFGDVRHALLKAKISKKYNLYYADGVADPESLNAAADWVTGDYLEDIIAEAAAQIPGPAIVWGGDKYMTDQTILLEKVARNLSNTFSDMGGWSAATVAECVEPIFKATGLSMRPGLDGQLYVVDQISTRADIAALSSVWMEGSYYRDTDNRFDRPVGIELVFEVRSEVALERPSGATSPGAKGLELANVMSLISDVTDTKPEFRWVPLIEWAQTMGQYSVDRGVAVFFMYSATLIGSSSTDARIARVYFKEQVFDYPLSQNGVYIGAGSEIVEYANEEVESHWRRAFKVYMAERNWCNVRLGRIEKDGGTSQAGNVVCDYTVVRRRGFIDGVPSPGQHVLAKASWSQSVKFTEFKNQPAPFTATWVDTEALILKLMPKITNYHIVKGAVVGTMKLDAGGVPTKLGFGEFVELKEDADPQVLSLTLARTKQQGELAGDYRIRVIANGSPITDARREKVLARTAFPATGAAPTLRLKVGGMTANYAFSDAQMALPDLLAIDADDWLNSTECNEIADRVQKEVLRANSQTKIGAIKIGGTVSLAGGSPIEAGGECNEMWIEVGAEGKPYTVTTHYSVRPGLILITLGRRKLDGDPIRMAIY